MADDQNAQVTGESAEDVLDSAKVVLELTDEFASITDQVFGVGKSKMAGTTAAVKAIMHSLKLGGHPLQSVNNARVLGGHVSFIRATRNKTTTNRIGKACFRLTRGQWLPCRFNIKADVLASGCTKLASFGVEITRVGKTHWKKYRAAMVRALMSESRKLRCSEIVISLFADGKRVDLRQQMILNSIMQLHRMILRDPAILPLVTSCHEQYARGASFAPGPISTFREHVTSLGWFWPEPEILELKGENNVQGRFEFGKVCRGMVFDVVSLALDRLLWKEASERRPALSGIEGGIDTSATLDLYHTRKWQAPVELTLYRSILTDAIWTGARLVHTGLVVDDCCPFCAMLGVQQPHEDQEHRWWTCPWFTDVREKPEHAWVIQKYNSEGHTWARCLITSGIMPEDPVVYELQMSLSLQQTPGRFMVQDLLAPLVDEKLDFADRVCVYGDGGANFNDDARFCRSGCGGFWGREHPYNFKIPVQGTVQGPDAAELLAVVAVLEMDTRPLHLFWDNESVVLGVRLRMHAASRPKFERGKHSLLWQRVSKALADRADGSIEITWTEGHAAERRAARTADNAPQRPGFSDALAMVRNDAADHLATQAVAALSSPVLNAAQVRAKQRAKLARAVQSLMLDIAQKAFEHYKAHGPPGIDEVDSDGSDPGNSDDEDGNDDIATLQPQESEAPEVLSQRRDHQIAKFEKRERRRARDDGVQLLFDQAWLRTPVPRTVQFALVPGNPDLSLARNFTYGPRLFFRLIKYLEKL